MALTPTSDDAFVREVDDELRRDELLGVWRSWGRWIIGAIVGGLLIFGGVLWWRQHQLDLAAEQGEKMNAAFEQLVSGSQSAASTSLATLAASKNAGFRDVAKMTQANIALGKKDYKTAAARFGEVASDTAAPQAMRDLALIRQTSVEFDQLKPETVVARLSPLAVKGAPWFGSAGEMVALAQYRMGKRDAAIRMLRDLTGDSSVPESLRQRAVQLADVLSTPATAAAAPVEEKQTR